MTLSSQDRVKALKHLRALNEERLRNEVLIPLYKVLGFINVVEAHGHDEFGKDILFEDVNRFGDKVYIASLVKAKAIHGSTSQSGNVSEVLAQAREALQMPFPDRFDGFSKKSISMLYIVTSGSIKPKARQYISESLRTGAIRFQDGDQILSLIEQKFPSIIDDWFKGRQITAFSKTTVSSSDFYPSLMVYFKHHKSGEPISIIADFDSGATASLVSKEFLDSIGLGVFDNFEMMSLHLGKPFVYVRNILDVSLDGKVFKAVPILVVTDWNASPFSMINRERVMLLGRDIPRKFGASIELNFSRLETKSSLHNVEEDT